MKRLAYQSGQSSTEYLVVSLIVLMLLALSYGEHPSVIDFFLESVRTGFDKFSSFISLPI